MENEMNINGEVWVRKSSLKENIEEYDFDPIYSKEIIIDIDTYVFTAYVLSNEDFTSSLMVSLEIDDKSNKEKDHWDNNTFLKSISIEDGPGYNHLCGKFSGEGKAAILKICKIMDEKGWLDE